MPTHQFMSIYGLSFFSTVEQGIPSLCRWNRKSPRTIHSSFSRIAIFSLHFVHCIVKQINFSLLTAAKFVRASKMGEMKWMAPSTNPLTQFSIFLCTFTFYSPLHFSSSKPPPYSGNTFTSPFPLSSSHQSLLALPIWLPLKEHFSSPFPP